MYRYIAFTLLIVSAVIWLPSCDDKNVTPPNEEELITTLEVRLTPVGGGPDAVFLFRDVDGDGGQPPVITVDTLVSGMSYSGRITLLNESVTPPIDISEEVEEEAEDHQFFLLLQGGLTGVTIAYADVDANGHPLGLNFTLQAGAAGSGLLEVVLRHLPDKEAAGVAAGDIANAGGETDIQVAFPVVVE